MTERQKHILRKSLASLEKSELIDLLLQQAERLEKLEQLEEEVTRLRDDLTRALRAQKRQAAPFGRERRTKEPKRRGRKKGHSGSYRKPSAEPEEDEEVPLECCPQCGGEVEDLSPIDQVIEEIPPIQPRIVRLRTYSGHCDECGTVYSSHPLQVGRATGSAKVQLGPGATHWVLKLRHRFGLSTYKTGELLQAAFGLPLSPGAVCQLEQRIAHKLLPDYEQLIQQARQAQRIHVDETSWYVGEPGHWLFVFTNDDLTLYDINQHRNRQAVEQVLGKDFAGTLISDCLSIYETYCQDQQKCYSHHLRAISAALKAYPKSSYLKLVRRLLLKAIAYSTCRDAFKPPDYQVLCQHLEKRADELLPTTLDEEGNYTFDEQRCPFSLTEVELKVAHRIAKRRQHLYTFLYKEQVPPTNNLAERQLRPAVIQRKISCGNRTAKGAKAWKIIRSVMVTNQHNDKDFSNTIYQAIQRDL